MGYFINDTDLSTFGIVVKKLTGFETFPKRKGSSSYSFPDQNGVDPFISDGEIFFESRDIVLDLHFLADTVQDAQVNFNNFFTLLSSSGEKQLRVGYLDRIFCTFFMAGSQAKRIGSFWFGNYKVLG